LTSLKGHTGISSAARVSEKTGFKIRKRKVLYTHRKLLRTVLLIICLADFYLNLRHTPRAQVQHSNWNIAYTFEQLAKIKSDSTYKACKEIAQHFKKCVKSRAKHNFYTKHYLRENSAKQLVWMATTSAMLIYKVLDEITQAILLIIGRVHQKPGPISRQGDQLLVKHKMLEVWYKLQRKSLS
jgi:hypothetical protein